MAVINGVGGNVTVAATSDLKSLVDTGISPSGWVINYSKSVVDTTGFGATTAKFASGPYSWTAQITGVYSNANPITGVGGLVTWGDGYVANAVGWTMDIAWPEFSYVPFAAAGQTRAEAIGGVPSWSGTIEALLDHSTPLTIGTLDPDTIGGDTGTAATFKLNELGDDPDATMAGNIILVSANPTVQVGQLSTATINYQGTGNLTLAGTPSLLAAGAIDASPATAVVFTAATGRTYTGDAFLTGLSVSVKPEEAVSVTATLRGTGDLTVA